MRKRRAGVSVFGFLVSITAVTAVLAIALGVSELARHASSGSTRGDLGSRSAAKSKPLPELRRGYSERLPVIDTSGFLVISTLLPKWNPDVSLEELSAILRGAGYRSIEDIDKRLADPARGDQDRVADLLLKSALFNFEGEPEKSYQVLEGLRAFVGRDDRLAAPVLASVIYCQGISALRRGENENCIMCRGESSCILPILPAAVHTNPAGSRLAIKHFTEYLAKFPDDLEIRWLLNLAHMTLGEYPDQVDPRFRLDLSRFLKSEFDVGKFRDVGHLVGVNRLNQSGGAIMEDFDNDGLLDVTVSSYDPSTPLAFYRNKGDSTFEDLSTKAGVTSQLGGLVCYQTDYDNDGWMDIYVSPRGLAPSSRPADAPAGTTGAGGFVDVTRQANFARPRVNSNAAAWADFDNDGWLDLFVACEKQTNRLYHNKGNGTFEEVAARAGVQGSSADFCKGCTWIDFDNDRYPDLFLNNLAGDARLYHNNRDGSFADVTAMMRINGPYHGFSCWAWDFDNDGWLDIFATCYDRTLGDVVKGLLGQPHSRYSSRLYRNLAGKGFEDVTKQAGLDMVFATMGSNFGDFDNDGWLDMCWARA